MCKLKKKFFENYNKVFDIVIRFKYFLERFKSIENTYIYYEKISKIDLKYNICRLEIDILHLAEFDSFQSNL